MLSSIIMTIILGYLIGCFQTSYILIRLIKKQDIRRYGFGNAGASNTVSAFGWKLGAIVAVVDILKPILSIFILKQLIATGSIDDHDFLVMLNGFFVILGHNYPFYLKFRGGKGTASLIGLGLAIDLFYGSIGIGIFIISAVCTNYIVIGTFSFLIYFTGLTFYLGMDRMSILIAFIISIQSIVLHIPNIKRIANDTETKITSKISGSKN
ncbi:MAG: glycerol-3-phosphate acyltransferase [Peptostreptococcaceae bacterium]|nr:glycerol-3-phosphate acyltransferase [Peptostreptococcaceae bacterium]